MNTLVYVHKEFGWLMWCSYIDGILQEICLDDMAFNGHMPRMSADAWEYLGKL